MNKTLKIIILAIMTVLLMNTNVFAIYAGGGGSTGTGTSSGYGYRSNWYNTKQ